MAILMGFNLILDTASPDLNVSFKDFTSFIGSLNQKKCKLDTWYPNMAGIWYRTELADKISASQQRAQEKKNVSQVKKGTKAKGKKQGKSGNDDYLGTKK